MLLIKNEKLRRVIKIIIPFIAAPLVVFMGEVCFKPKRYLWISLVVAVLALLLFASSYEKKKTGSRRMVIVAVMTALCIVGRLIPFFKPVTALTIITAMYLGGESGFLVGALAAVLSNFYFGQGPWTPFQMLAWGFIGLFSGFLAPILKKSKVFLLIYGVLCGIVFSFIMDVWTVLWYDSSFDIKLYVAAIGTAIPHTILYSISNFIFLWALSKPFGDKLERIKIKYGV